MSTKLYTVALALGLSGCAGEEVTAGFEEPLRIPEAQFREGELPGESPLAVDEINGGVNPTPPAVFGVTVGNALVASREPGRGFSGFASPDSVSIGVRFADLGHGYWILPTRNADAVNDGALEWRFRAAFGEDLPTGRKELLFAAFDKNGKSGTQVGLTLCLLPDVPDNGNACDPSTDPPATVVSLAWDAPVDLDLRVITPSGKVVTPKHPSTAEEDEDGLVDPSTPGVGTLDRDSFANCLPNGRRRENLVFQTQPPRGVYLVYAGLFDACGEPGAGFTVSLHTAARRQDGEGKEPKETYRQAGQVSAVHADGGTKLGTFITTFEVK